MSLLRPIPTEFDGYRTLDQRIKAPYPPVALTPLRKPRKKKGDTVDVTNAPSEEYKELSQYFTHPEWAKRIVRHFWPLMNLLNSELETILEPAAGKGAFLQWLPSWSTGVEIHTGFRAALQPYTSHLIIDDFFNVTRERLGRMPTVVIGNPPYEQNKDIRFVQHAFNLGAEHVIFIMQTKFLNTALRHKDLWQWAYCETLITIPRSAIIAVGEHGPMRDYAVFHIRRRTSSNPEHKYKTEILHWG